MYRAIKISCHTDVIRHNVEIIYVTPAIFATQDFDRALYVIRMQTNKYFIRRNLHTNIAYKRISTCIVRQVYILIFIL